MDTSGPSDTQNGGTDATPEACLEALRLLARFVGGGLAPDDERTFRQHLVTCRSCMESYRSMMASAARLGRSARTRREEAARDRRRSGLRTRALAATGDMSRRRRFGLRLALLPAGIALLILMWQASGGTSSLVAHWDGEGANGGQVLAADQLLGPERPRLVLGRGDWCETRRDSMTRIELERARGELVAFDLDEYTHVQIEDLRVPRIRLQQGSVIVRGPAAVTTSLGVLRVLSGATRLRLSRGGYALECIEGEADWTGPESRRTLLGGERAEGSLLVAEAR